MAGINKYCVVCRKEHGPYLDKCCTERSLVAAKKRGFFRQTVTFFSLVDGRELSQEDLQQLCRIETARMEEEKRHPPQNVASRRPVAPGMKVSAAAKPDERKSIAMTVAGVRAICLGFVNFDPGEEGNALLLDLIGRWNPAFFSALKARPPQAEFRVLDANTADEVVHLLKRIRDNDHPDCDLVVQSGAFEMHRRSTGSRFRIEVVLATYHVNETGRPTVVAGANLTIEPV